MGFKSRNLILAILFFLYNPIYLFNGLNPHPFSSATTVQNTFDKYFRIFELIKDDSSSQSIALLHSFLEGHPDFENVYLKLQQVYLLHDKVAEAQEYFQRLIEKPENRRNSYWMLAKIFNHQEKSEEAFEAFIQALKINNNPSYALLYNFIQFDVQQAEKFHESSLLSIEDFVHYPPKIVSALYIYARSDYENAVKTFSQLPDHLSENSVVFRLFGLSYYRLKKYNQAELIWLKGLQNSRAIGDLQAEAEFLWRLGKSNKSTDYRRAICYLDSSRTVAIRIGDSNRLNSVALDLGQIYLNHGEFRNATEEYEIAFALAQKLRKPLWAAKSSLSLAVSLSQLGRFSEAFDAYDRCEKIARAQNYYRLLAKSKRQIGELYLLLNQYELAKVTYEEGYNIAHRYGISTEIDRIAANLGDLYVKEEKYEKARQKYRNFIDTDNLGVKVLYLLQIAKTYELEKKYDKAISTYREAYENAKLFSDKVYMANSMFNIAHLKVINGDLDEAFQKYSLSLDLATTAKDSQLIAEIQLGLGDAYYKSKEIEKAISNYKISANIIEKTRQGLGADQIRVEYFSNKQQVYRKLAQCYLTRYESDGNYSDLDRLFYALEMSRARALQDLKVGNRTSVNSEEYDEYLKACKVLSILLRRWRDRAAKFATNDSLDLLIAQIEAAQYSILAQRMRLASATTDESTLSPSLPSLGAVQKQLKQNELGLLLYHIDEEGSFVMAVQGDDIKIKRLSVTPNLLEASIDSFITPFHNVNEDLVSQVPFKATIANRLYEFLVKPVEEFNLPKRLLIVRDITLMKLPFEMLLTETPYKTEYIPKDEPDYADYFLINRYSIVYTPSTSLLQTSPMAGSPNQDVLLFANPFAASQKPDKVDQQFTLRTGMRFDPLLYSEIEANRIKEIYSDTRIYKREKATSLSFLEEASKYQYLHLATHAFVNTKFDAFSGLVLAASADSTDDGILMGYEIADLNLSSDLVTLSACETGRGKIIDGEGVLGLPRLFLGAGAKSVLMTHWKVDDKFASEMMPAFYNYYLNKGLSKGDALANAKRDILGRSKKVNDVYYQHPFYWASFTLYGDPGQERKSTFWYKASVMAAILILVIVIIVRKRANLKILP